MRSVAIAGAALLVVACGGPALPVEAASKAAAPLPVERGESALPRPADVTAPSLAERTWYLSFGREKVTVELAIDDARPGRLVRSDGRTVAVSDGWVRGPAMGFRTTWQGMPTWVRGVVTSGVFRGTYFLGETPPQREVDVTGFVTGWSRAAFEVESGRTFRLELSTGAVVTLRLDVGASGPLGRWKQVGAMAGGSGSEGAELDLSVSRWDGRAFEFDVMGGPEPRRCSGLVEGRDVSGRCRLGSGAMELFRGVRIEVLGFGLASRSPASRAEWQERTRAVLEALVMAGNPRPLHVEVTSGPPLEPIERRLCLPERDDDVEAHPAVYTRQEVTMQATYPTSFGEAAEPRTIHGFLLVPRAPPPLGGFPAVIALNGHNGSAAGLISPDDELHWYGDGFARRQRVVFALDLSHRPYLQRWMLYGDYRSGDDPGRGNGVHPAIGAAGLPLEWEEDGERISDVLRARDLLASRPDVDQARISVAGLSMGGAIANWAAAIEPALQTAIVAGYAPDFEVMRLGTNHRCWQWQQAELNDYLTASDLHALVAPRRLVVQTGARDTTFSAMSTPWAADLQVARRARVAWSDDALRYVHYLHPDGHRFHVADVQACGTRPAGLTVPVFMAPTSTTGTEWQLSSMTMVLAQSLFAWLDNEPP